MYLEIKVKGEGMHPSELLIEIKSENGIRQAFYHGDSIVRTTKGAYIDIGNPIDQTDDSALVDIGREMTDGAHRVWVAKSKVFETVPMVFLQGDARVMTWGELKALVEKSGATDDTPVGEVEVYCPLAGGTTTVELVGGNLTIKEMERWIICGLTPPGVTSSDLSKR